MQEHEKGHYSCLCVVCHKLIEYPLCNDCAEEAERAVQEELKQQKRKPPETEPVRAGVKIS